LLTTRPTINDKSLRAQFDKSFEGVLASLESLRETAKSIKQLYGSHADAVADGTADRIVKSDIYVQKSIDVESRKEVESLINTAVRATKERMKALVKILDINIGFLF
jgi:hypothetical protein